MNRSGTAGVPRGGGLRRGHWVVLGAIALCLVLVGGVLLYLSPVLALLDNHDLSPAKPVATPAATPPPLDSKQRVNILLLGSDNDQKFAQNAVLSQTMIVVSIDPAKRQRLWDGARLPGRRSAAPRWPTYPAVRSLAPRRPVERLRSIRPATAGAARHAAADGRDGSGDGPSFFCARSKRPCQDGPRPGPPDPAHVVHAGLARW